MRTILHKMFAMIAAACVIFCLVGGATDSRAFSLLFAAFTWALGVYMSNGLKTWAKQAEKEFLKYPEPSQEASLETEKEIES